MFVESYTATYKFIFLVEKIVLNVIIAPNRYKFTEIVH